MPDGSHEAHVPLSAEALDRVGRRAWIAAVAEARADPQPDIPHEEVRAEILQELEETLAALSKDCLLSEMTR